MESNSRPGIVIERNIPFIEGMLDRVANVSYLNATDITPEAMRQADALITRTRTRCDAALLDGSQCSLIASATIGLDHVDLDYCRTHGIKVANAPGCNAPAVAQYVLASTLRLMPPTASSHPVLGIVGVGHVGSIVERWARALGYDVLLCDPPRARVEGPDGFVDLDTIAARADIVTFHTPYTRQGDDATHHLCDASFLNRLQRRPIIINSARGAIVDTPALVEALQSGRVSHAVIDCWVGEPSIDPTLLQLATFATPHIAGYSHWGKVRATLMAVDAVSRHFGITPSPMTEPTPPPVPHTVSAEAILASYNPAIDTDALRSNPQSFESLRNNYHLRPEP